MSGFCYVYQGNPYVAGGSSKGFAGSYFADMDASDTAYVRIYQAGGTAQTDIDAETHFSGFLAC